MSDGYWCEACGWRGESEWDHGPGDQDCDVRPVEVVRERMTREECEVWLEERYGPEWRDLAIVTPIATIRLRDIPDEFGPPRPLRGSDHVLTEFGWPVARGLWQTAPPVRGTFDARENARAALERLKRAGPGFRR